MTDTDSTGNGGDESFNIFGPLERSGLPRGVALLVGAVVIVALLLSSGTRPGLGTASAARTAPPTSAAAPPVTSSTTTVASTPKSAVKVLVANGTNTNGAAAAVSSLLSGKGFSTLTPVDALTTVSASEVYAIGGATTAARLVATALGLDAARIEPSSQAVPVASSAGATVVVIVGPDLVTRS